MRTGLTFDDRTFRRGMKQARVKMFSAGEEAAGLVLIQVLNDTYMDPPTVPYLEGFLRSSSAIHIEGRLTDTGGNHGYQLGGHAEVTDLPLDPDEILGIISFNQPYATRLHEHPEFNFSEPGAGGKFLEHKIKFNEDFYQVLLAKIIRRRFRQ